MLLFKHVTELQQHLKNLRAQGDSIGFVPTMGALHKGHLSLISASIAETDCTVCSIFVNPTQFNDAADLEKYPRTTAHDIELLAEANCDILFLPSVDEIYPDGAIPLELDFGYLDQPMEGANRPGHFAGMAQVVNRLLEIVAPNKLFMGQKDYQQAAIVRNMLGQLGSSIELVVCPIIREDDGLALSSRNLRLTAKQRALAPRIHQVLANAKKKIGSKQPNEIEKEAMAQLNIPGFEPEYFEVVDGITLRGIDNFEDTKLAVACTAVRVGKIRLIDNMIILNKQ